jgi:hypothetical protein
MATKYYGRAGEQYSRKHMARLVGEHTRVDPSERKQAQLDANIQLGQDLYGTYTKGMERIAEAKLGQSVEIGEKGAERAFDLYEETPIEGGPVESFLRSKFEPPSVRMRGGTVSRLLEENPGRAFESYGEKEWSKVYSEAYGKIEDIGWGEKSSIFDKSYGSEEGLAGVDTSKYESFKAYAEADPETARGFLTEQVATDVGIEQMTAPSKGGKVTEAYEQLKSAEQFTELGTEALKGPSMGSKIASGTMKGLGTAASIYGMGKGFHDVYQATQGDATVEEGIAGGASAAGGYMMMFGADPVTKGIGATLVAGSSLYDLGKDWF